MTLTIPLTTLANEDRYIKFLESIEAEHNKKIENVILK